MRGRLCDNVLFRSSCLVERTTTAVLLSEGRIGRKHYFNIIQLGCRPIFYW